MSLPTYPSPEGPRWAAPRKARTPIVWYEAVLGLAAPWGVLFVALPLMGIFGTFVVLTASFVAVLVFARRIARPTFVWAYLAGLLSVLARAVALLVVALQHLPH